MIAAEISEPEAGDTTIPVDDRYYIFLLEGSPEDIDLPRHSPHTLVWSYVPRRIDSRRVTLGLVRRGLECGQRGDFRFILDGKVVDPDDEWGCSSCIIENKDYLKGGRGSLENPYYLFYQYGSPTEPADDAESYWFILHWDQGGSYTSGEQVGKIPRGTPLETITFRRVRQSVRRRVKGDYRFRLSKRSQYVWDWKQEGTPLVTTDALTQGKGTSIEPYRLQIWFTDQS